MPPWLHVIKNGLISDCDEEKTEKDNSMEQIFLKAFCKTAPMPCQAALRRFARIAAMADKNMDFSMFFSSFAALVVSCFYALAMRSLV